MNKKTKELFSTLWLAAIVLCVILALFAVIFASCSRSGTSSAKTVEETDESEATASDAASAEPEVTPSPTPMATTIGETDDAGDEYLGTVMIYGGSDMTHICDLGLLDSAQVITPSDGEELTAANAAEVSVETYGTSATSLDIGTALEASHPAVLILAVSSDGLSELDETTFKQDYTALITEVQNASASTVILCQSIFPAADDDELNSTIRQANEWILQVAEETGAHYLNTYEMLIDSTGSLYSVYEDEDGTMTQAGCETVVDYIRTHAV